MEIQTLLFLFFAALIAEYVNVSIGMMYGTFLSPLLVGFGFDPLIVIPSVLLSQGLGGIPASFLNHKFKNAIFSWNKVKNSGEKVSHDLLVALAISGAGIVATVAAVFLAVAVPKWVLTAYIALIAIAMGLVLLFQLRMHFSWKKIVALGVIGSFNKGFTGGGFGPIISSGQVAVGRKIKSSIAVTMFSEVPICTIGFLIYWKLNGFANWEFLLALSLGSVMGAPFGVFSTRFIKEHNLKPLMGSLAVFLGIWMIIKLLIS